MAGAPLTQLLIKPAGPDCNIRCHYCFYLQKHALWPDRRIHRMSNEALREMVRQMMEARQQQVGFSWQGGEPTLMGLDFFKQAVRYQQQFGQSGQVVANSLQTNGLLIKPEWCRFFAEYRFLVGLSMDGPPDVHDHYRRTVNQKDTHKYAMRAAEMMNEHEVEFNILAVVNDHSARNAKRIYEYFRDNGFLYLQFIPAIERDPTTGGPAPFTPAPEAFGDFLCELFDVWKSDFRDGWPIVSERTFDSLMHTHLGYPAPMCIFTETCGDYVVVEHSGDVYSCDFFVEPACHLGNLLNRELRLLAATEKQYEFGMRKADLTDECKECRWLRHCNGGCLKDRYAIASTKGQDYLCKGYKQFFAHSESTFLELRDRFIEQNGPPMAPQAQMPPQQGIEPAGEPYGGPAAPIGRNDPCPCGSGKKFKKCCMRVGS